MQTDVFMEARLGQLVPCVLSLSMLIHLCLAAPGLPGTQRQELVDAHSPSVALPNPFGSGEDERRLLQTYIQSSLMKEQGGPEISTWEQEVFFLFGLYDYDRSGFLDGLEMMKLLSNYTSHHTPGAQASEQVVSMVDFLLQTQDLNQDGLLTPSELLSPPITQTQDSSNNVAPHQDQQVAAEDTLLNTIGDQEDAAVEQMREEGAHEEIQLQHDMMTEEEKAIHQVDEHTGQQIQEAPVAEQGQDHNIPVHQGQPEI